MQSYVVSEIPVDSVRPVEGVVHRHEDVPGEIIKKLSLAWQYRSCFLCFCGEARQVKKRWEMLLLLSFTSSSRCRTWTGAQSARWCSRWWWRCRRRWCSKGEKKGGEMNTLVSRKIFAESSHHLVPPLEEHPHRSEVACVHESSFGKILQVELEFIFKKYCFKKFFLWNSVHYLGKKCAIFKNKDNFSVAWKIVFLKKLFPFYLLVCN